MEQFILGGNVVASSVIGLFFLRFWRKTGDQLFLCFSLAFWLLGCNWLALALVNRDELQTALYSVRLVAFGLILLGIWIKNRQRSDEPNKES